MLRQRDYELASCVCRGGTTPNMYRLIPVGGDGHRASSAPNYSPRPPDFDSYDVAPSRSRPLPPSHSNSSMSVSAWLRSSILPSHHPLQIDMDLIPTPALQASRIFTASGPAPIADQVFHANWPPNLPPIDLLDHLVQTFFQSTPFATRLLHQPTFMANLRCAPESSEFPYVSVLPHLAFTG